MSKAFNIAMLCCGVSIFFSAGALAGDVLPAGAVLEEESYVFTIEEATELLRRVEELEIKEERLNYYLELEPIHEQKFTLYQSNIDLYKFQVTEYQHILNISQLEIDRLHKRQKWRWLENYGMLFIGVAVTTSSFLIADAVTDHMQQN
jgi:hypothetical protein